MNVNKVDYRFKLLYFFGIIFVIAGHCNNGGISLFYDWFPVYSFHLGLFVFCSGYLYKECSDHGFWAYFTKKFNKLIVPLYLYNIIYGLIVSFLSFKGFTIGTGGNFIAKLLWLPITDGHQFIYNMGGWFVIPLFMVQIFTVCFRKILHKFFAKFKFKEFIFFIVYLILGILGVYIASKGYNTGLYLVLVRFLYFLPFMGLGLFYKTVVEKYDNLSNLKYFSIIFSIALVVIYIVGKFPTYTPSWCNNFVHGPFMPFIVGYLGIFFWLRIAKILSTVIGKSAFVNLVAEHTYSIMINQLMGFMLLKTFFAIINKLTGLCRNFDWKLYKNSIWYMYLPKELHHFRILYLVVGLLFPIGLSILLNKIKNSCRNFKGLKLNFKGNDS